VLGFPIRTPSDHSSVDSSPRPIAASHVLHRLLMPRHPPCALKHLTTTRCSHPLCNTQHTTTPRPSHRHHTKTSCVRPARPRAVPRNTPHKVSSQDPTVCEPAKTVRNLSSRSVPPSHTHASPANAGTTLRSGVESVKGDPSPYSPTNPHRPTELRGQVHHQYDGSLERR
jgi:hypothetical protein